MIKELELPEEVKNIFRDYVAAISCRDHAISSLFKAKRAIYYGREAEKSRILFWEEVHKLYPEYPKGQATFTYNMVDDILTVDYNQE